MKKILFLLLLCRSVSQAQELFVYTEPASNMPANSLGARVTNMFMKEQYSAHYQYHLVPELMWGANKKFMLHADGFISNQTKNLSFEGGSFYVKYRFLSNDRVHNHFRMAAYGRISFNNNEIQQEEIDLYGYNSGYQAGIVATQLLNKFALSGNINYAHATDNGSNNKFPSNQSASAVNYSFSVGKLMLPKEYVSYKQVNLNLMVEVLGQTLVGNRRSYLDVAPALQFIFNSQLRIDAGYRKQLYSSMYRTSPNGFLVRFEYLFFNAFKK
ncbi:MAG TPA: hypothetical protein VH396_17815 [Chitinophagaceae bacterium]